MMKRYLFTLLTLILTHFAIAQNIQWATEVIEFSSELSPYEYSATQVLGKPNVLPQAGDNPNAWLPAKPNRTEFIKVGFDYPMSIQQVAIAESYNPSSIYQIFLYDRSGNEYLLNTFDPRPIELEGRLFNIFIDETEYEVSAIKIVLNGMAVPGYSGIDAIGMSDTKEPIEVEVEVVENVATGMQTEKLSENVNSEFRETRPLIAPDGRTLFFSRSNHPDNIGGVDDNNDVWFSELDEATGDWQEAENLGTPLNTAGPNYISSITPDGKSMVVLLGNEYDRNGKMKPGVSISTKTEGGWSQPTDVDIVNSYIEGTDGNYFLAQNRRVIIMAIERYDTHGGKDLYVSFLQENGKWTEPMNLGNDINTAHDESSPFLAADDETLYFSSKGFSGFGGSDIYISRRLDATWTNWTEPENLGRDINSQEDDVFFNIPPSGTYAYFTKGVGEEDADIHRIEMPIFYQPSPVVTVSGKIINSATNEPVEAKVTYELMPEEKQVGLTLSEASTGNYQIVLPSGASYRYIVEAPGFEPQEETINLLQQENYKEIDRNITLTPSTGQAVASGGDILPGGANAGSESGRPNVLEQNVQFGFNSDALSSRYTHNLNLLAEFIKRTDEVTVEVAGHSDNVGNEDYNFRLSQRRAEAVKQHLISRGVAEDRLVVVAFGENDPVASNETERGREQNRRVVFRIR